MQKPAISMIDGKTYVFGHWDVLKALEVWAWLLSSMGPAVRDVFSLWQDKSKPGMDADGKPLKQAADLDQQLALDAFGIVINTLRSSIPPSEYSVRMISFCSDIICDGVKVDPRLHFRGNLLHMHKVVVEVLRFQLGDFLDEALSLLK